MSKHLRPPTVKVTTTPADRSTVVLEVEVAAEQVQRAIDEAVRHQARASARARASGPGKVPRPMLERALGIDRTDPEAARPHLRRRPRAPVPAQPSWTPREQEDLDVLELPGDARVADASSEGTGCHVHA